MKILLVDDDEDIREFAAFVLENAGYDVHVAGSVEGAVALFAAGATFDLMITDVVMPGGGGIELANCLRRTQPHAKVLFATGYTRHIVPDELALAEILDKPYQRETLLHAVRRLIGN